MPTEPLISLHWQRLRAEVMNIRAAQAMKADPISIVQAIVKGVTLSLPGGAVSGAEPPIFHIKDRKHSWRMSASDTLSVDILFCRRNSGYAEVWKQAFTDYLADPETGKNFAITTMGELEERSYEKLAAELGAVPDEGEACLEFLTPFPFKREKERHRSFIAKQEFISAFTRRYERLFGADFTYRPDTDDFTVLPYYWSYTEIKHPSRSQEGETQFLKGCVGNLYLKGKFGRFLPYLILGSELHAGVKLSNAQGYYRLHKGSLPYFDAFFPNKKALIPVIHDVLEHYDSAAEHLAASGRFPFDENAFADDLCARLRDGSYLPSPATAFSIKKKDGTERRVEQPTLTDLIAQKYVLRIISEPCERMFEESSIGFRKGLSRQKSEELIRAALSEGYRWVIESDIEDFFPSVDLGLLSGLLDRCLPQDDRRMKQALQAVLRTGYVLNGTLHERTRGLAQGSPLSPVLANLYLDSFDEQMEQWNVRLVRYADDFVVLTKTREDAERVLSQAETLLSGLGLRLNKAKTDIRDIKDGFTFLGLQFGKTETVMGPEETFQRLKKPLYITEPYLFLSVNGDAVDIKKNRELVETIPLRRISEIMVMERSVFSSVLVKKCTDFGIPLTITLNSGYYITTVKPDSKKYYDITYEHGRKHYSLTETETLCLAKEFAAGKIRNYISLFRQRYAKERCDFLAELESTISDINQAGAVEQVRGYEGAAARKVYPRLNDIIDDETFHIKKRDRDKVDRINSLLNFGYYLLFSRINATVRAMGLNPYLGFLHSPENNYESLVCDIQELFRARIDRFIVRLINLKMIKFEDFVESERGMHLTHEGVRTYLTEFEKELERKQAANVLSLKENIYAQAMVFKNFVLENKPLSFYTWDV